MPRLLPRSDLLVKKYLELLLPSEIPTVQVGTQKTNVFERCPFIFVDEVTGGSEPHPQFLGIAQMSLECYAKPDRAAAADLAEYARAALWAVVDEQIVIPEGHLTSFETTTRFTEIRFAGQQADVYCYSGIISLGIRPN